MRSKLPFCLALGMMAALGPAAGRAQCPGVTEINDLVQTINLHHQKKHYDNTIGYLKERIRTTKRRTVSSFADLGTMRQAAWDAYKANEDEITKWFATAKNGSKNAFVIHKSYAGNVVTCLKPKTGTPKCNKEVDADYKVLDALTSATLALEKQNNRCQVTTIYGDGGD